MVILSAMRVAPCSTTLQNIKYSSGHLGGYLVFDGSFMGGYNTIRDLPLWDCRSKDRATVDPARTLGCTNSHCIPNADILYSVMRAPHACFSSISACGRHRWSLLQSFQVFSMVTLSQEISTLSGQVETSGESSPLSTLMSCVRCHIWRATNLLVDVHFSPLRLRAPRRIDRR